MQALTEFLDALDGVLYYPILLVVLTVAGIYFSIRTRFAQLRLCGESMRIVM